MGSASSPIRVEVVEADAHENKLFLYFRCQTASKSVGGRPTNSYYFHAAFAGGPTDLCLIECSGPYFLIRWGAKDHSRPYNYLLERSWTPVKFSKPPPGTTWSVLAIEPDYFGDNHATPRSAATINAAKLAYRAAQQNGHCNPVPRAPATPARSGQPVGANSPLATPATRQRVNPAPTIVRNHSPDRISIPASDVGSQEPVSPASSELESTDNLDGVEEAIRESEQPAALAMSNLDPELAAQFQAFLQFQQLQQQQRNGATNNSGRNNTAAVPNIVPDPFDDHLAQPTVRTQHHQDPRIREAGILLARIDQLTEAVKWREEALTANVNSFPLRVGPLQSPSGDRFSADLVDQLNATISECAKRCSELVLAEQRQTLAGLITEKDNLAEGWTRTNDERLAIQEARRFNTRTFTRRAIPSNPLIGPTKYFLPPSGHIKTIHPNPEIVGQQSTGQRRSGSRNRSESRDRSASRNRGRSRGRDGSSDQRDEGSNNHNNHNNRGNGRSVRFQRRGGRW